MKLHTEFPFNYEMWSKNAAADLERPPYFDSDGRVQRVFVNADEFPRWPAWKLQAEIARDAALCAETVFGEVVMRSSAPPLSEKPPFLIGYRNELWLNVALAERGQADFELALAAARTVRDERVREIRSAGFSPTPVPMVEYDPEDNSAGPLGNLFRDIR